MSLVRVVGELPDEAGLAYARLSDERDQLAVAASSPLQTFADRVHLRLAPDESREPPRGRCLEARAGEAGTGEFEDLDELVETLDRDWTEGLHADVALSQRERGRRDQDGSGHGHLLHPGGQVGRLTDRRVVH